MSDFSFIVMAKKEGETSFQSLRAVKQAYKGSKVGHCGTLDKFASGIMLVLTGEATRLNPIFSGFDKSYRALIKLGEETDTLDPEGEVIRKSEKIPTREEIEEILPSFIGPQKQLPPVYSAIHVNGKRAYREARAGRSVDMPERDIVVYSLSMLGYEDGMLGIDVSVSKGTYIRALARDIAGSLGSAGHLVKLERYRVGPFGYNSLTKIPAAIEETEANLGKVIEGRAELNPSCRFSVKNGFCPPGGVKIEKRDRIGLYRLYCNSEFVGVIKEERGRFGIIALSKREDL